MKATKNNSRGSFKILWSFVRPHRKTLTLGIVLGLLATGASLATPMLTKTVLDSLGAGADLLQPVSLLVGLLILGSITGFAQYVLLGQLSERIVFDARASLINRFFRSKLEDIQRMRPGELVTRVTSDTVLLREATTNSIVQLVNGTVSLVGTIVLMAVLDIPLLIATLITLVVIAVPLVIVVPKIGQAEKQAQSAVGELGSSLEAGMRALRTVKASGAEDREIASAHHKADTAARHAIRAVWVQSGAWTLAGGGLQLAIIAILGFGAWRVSLDALTVSALVAFLLYAFNIVSPVMDLTMAFTQLQSGLAASARIQETQHLPIEDLNTPAVPRSTTPVSDTQQDRLSLENVTAGYQGATPALQQLNFQIPRQGHIALVGPSGAGKTTIFSLLLRFIDPQSGEIRLDGVPYEQLSLQQVRSRIAYVEQETPVIAGTIADNVRYRYQDASDAAIWQALETVGLDQRVRSMPEGLETNVSATNLSGGERQRLAIARAIVGKPDLLLLDEATAQLDGVTEAAIQDAIGTLARTGTVLTIAHRLSTVVDADNIIVLEAGRIRAQGTHQELMAHDELYRDLVLALRIQQDTTPATVVASAEAGKGETLHLSE